VGGDAVEHDDPHQMTAPGQIIDPFPGGGLQRIAPSKPLGIAGGYAIEAKGAERMALALGIKLLSLR
jgi:hypothetical protein